MNNPNEQHADDSVFLRLNDIQPLDILLTAGSENSSKAIVFGQTISRATEGMYSHSALFLTPSMVFEANDPGIVVRQLVKGPNVDPDQLVDMQSPDRTRFFPRFEDGKVIIYVGLQGVSSACVLRHKSADTLPSKILFRDDMLGAMSYCFLAQYPVMIRLLRTAGFIPPKFLDFAEELSRMREKAVLTGPFCSELVILCLRNLRIFLSQQEVERAPESFNPTDLLGLDDWRPVESAVHKSGAEALPGTPLADKTLSEDLFSLLSLPMRFDQTFGSKLREVETRIALMWAAVEEQRRRADPTGTPLVDMNSLFTKHIQLLREISHYLNTICDSLWDWIHDANVCRIDCVANRQRAGHTISLDESTLSERFTLPSYKIKDPWDGSACPDLRSCALTGSLDAIKREYAAQAYPGRVDLPDRTSRRPVDRGLVRHFAA